VEEFVKLAAANGMDVFRIFDCFNDPEQMRVCVDAVRKHTRKVAEVCICYTADIRTSEIYNVEYYKDLTRRIVEMGAHIIAIKVRPPAQCRGWPAGRLAWLCMSSLQDMAGLLKPQSAQLLVETIRSVTHRDSLPSPVTAPRRAIRSSDERIVE
jgi:pyruvate carboxylase